MDLTALGVSSGSHVPTANFPMDTPAVGLSSSVGCACWGAQRAAQGLMFPSQLHPQPLCTSGCITTLLGPGPSVLQGEDVQESPQK